MRSATVLASCAPPDARDARTSTHVRTTAQGVRAPHRQMKLVIALALVGSSAAHSNLIKPKPRNSIDSLLPEWSGGKAPYVWQGGPAPYHPPCVCKNGTQPCESAQTCLWMSVGCSIGCKECDGGAQGGTNPSSKDRCKSGANATINEPLHRTINREAEAGSDADWSRWNPWRAPGTAREHRPSLAVSSRHSVACVTPHLCCCSGLGSLRPSQRQLSSDWGARRVYQHEVCEAWRYGLEAPQVSVWSCVEDRLCCGDDVEPAHQPREPISIARPAPAQRPPGGRAHARLRIS